MVGYTMGAIGILRPQTAMEGIFKTFFFFGVLIFCVLIVFLFLLILKVILLFTTPIHIIGMTIS